MWGSLSRLPGRTQVASENVQMQIWNMEWADPQDMYGEGFTIINSLNSSLYIIPGGGYDRLDLEALKQWEPVSYTHLDVYKRQDGGRNKKTIKM